MFEENRDQNRLKRPGPRSIDSSLYMKPCLFKEPVEELLIFFPQASPKLSPFLDFLFQNPAKRKDRPAHHSCSVSVPARRSAAFRHAGVTRVRSLINLETAGHCSKRIPKFIQCLSKVFAPSKWGRYRFFNLRFAICNLQFCYSFFQNHFWSLLIQIDPPGFVRKLKESSHKISPL